MSDLERLTEALGDWVAKAPTEGGYSEEHVSGVPSVRLAWISPDGYAHEVDPLMLNTEGIAKLCEVIEAARAYRDLLANGQRVGRDDVRALRVLLRVYGIEEGLPTVLSAWIGDRNLRVAKLLSVYLKEAENG